MSVPPVPVRAGPLAPMLVLLALAAVAGCSTGPPAPYQATVSSCYAFAVQALDRHVTVTSVPRACAGLSREQIDLVVERAVRDAVGPQPKAGRRLAHKEAAYLAYLVTVVPPPRAPAPPVAAPAGGPAGLPLDLGALGAWVVTVAAGARLAAGWLAGGGLRRGYRRAAGVPRPVIAGHLALAVAGLGIWVGFVATGAATLAWVAVGVILSVAGLGMATLAGGLPAGRRRGPARGRHGGQPRPACGAGHGGARAGGQARPGDRGPRHARGEHDPAGGTRRDRGRLIVPVRQHELLVHPLIERVPGCQLLQFRYELGMFPRRQPGLGQCLRDPQPQQVQPPGLLFQPGPVRQRCRKGTRRGPS